MKKILSSYDKLNESNPVCEGLSFGGIYFLKNFPNINCEVKNNVVKILIILQWL